MGFQKELKGLFLEPKKELNLAPYMDVSEHLRAQVTFQSAYRLYLAGQLTVSSSQIAP